MQAEIKAKKQELARLERHLQIEKVKKRKADTRKKIQLGGLVIKAGMASFDKEVILGALMYSLSKIKEDDQYLGQFAALGKSGFQQKD